jgi:chlorite dismutase
LNVNSQLVQAALQRLSIELPKTLLIIAPEMPSELLEYSAQAENVTLTHVAFDSLEKSVEQLGRFDFVIVVDTLEKLKKQTAQHLVSRLRDIHAKLLWVAVTDHSDYNFGSQDAIAQGMRMVEPQNFGSKDSQWYEFSLKFYKPVPQWLNAKNWANPQNWEKTRW